VKSSSSWFEERADSAHGVDVVTAVGHGDLIAASV